MPFNRLSLDAINSVSPCKVDTRNGYEFVFHTHTNVVYLISFKEDMRIANEQSYQLIIERVTDKVAYDTDVKDTIICIINEFFTKNDKILLYICDTADGRESVRNRLFLRWFEESDVNHLYDIKTANATVEGEGMYFAIILKKSNPHYIEIIQEFDTVATELTNK